MKDLIHTLVNTHDCRTALIARLTLGIVMFVHGSQKLLGWFGGNGLHPTLEFFTNTLHLHPLVAWLVILGEFLGAIALLTGAFTRLAAAAIGLIMIGAIAMIHHQYGFFMNWTNQQKGEGYEYHLLALGLALISLLAGGGKASVDRCLTSRLCEEEELESPRYRR